MYIRINSNSIVTATLLSISPTSHSHQCRKNKMTTIFAESKKKKTFPSSAAFQLPSLLLLLVIFPAWPALSGQLVEYLPGYNGKLPFKLETGYITVGDSEMFYYFIESQGNPVKDPLFLWLTGGPGCSSFSAIIYEIGPIAFDIENFNGSLPTLLNYPYAWTKHGSFLFLDSPVGTGFSYSTTQAGWPSSDTKAAKEAYNFFLKWLEENPKYLALETYISGDSYSGLIVPQITLLVVEGLEAQVHPRINLKGMLLGSPTTDQFINNNVKIPFAHRMALISDEIYESAKTNCNGNYLEVDPSNTQCVLALQQYEKCVADIYQNCILEPTCTFALPHEMYNRRSLEMKLQPFVLSPPKLSDLWCRNFNYVLAYNWANDPSVRDALHVRKGTVPEWVRCNLTISYVKDVESVIYIHKILTSKELYVMVNCGDRDMVVPFNGIEEWIGQLNLTVDDGWRPWFIDGQVAGYTEKYYTIKIGYHLVFATVKGAGHTAPEYQRERSYYMFDRWVHYYPL